ncbi:MAG: hypothetical protein LC745_03950 [Planctomycetia bacterium]|nr:hypothetical protein [Planctomycetia bacterium]
MRLRRPITAGLVSLGLLVASAAVAQKGGEPATGRALDPSVTGVRLLLGVGDTTPRTWNGKVKLDRGEVIGVEGWRFREGDLVTGRDSWEARSRLIRKAAPKKQQQAAVAGKKAASGPSTFGPAVTPNGVVVSLKAPDDATLTVETERGNFEVKLADLKRVQGRRYLDGQAVAHRVPPSVPLAGGPDQEDFPAAVGDGQGGAWVVYVTHKPRGPVVSTALESPPKDFAAFAPTGGGDQIKMVHLVNGSPGDTLDVTAEGLDVWRPAVAVDGKGGVVVVWSENRGGNFDLFRRRYDPGAGRWSDASKLTDNPGTDTDPALASSPDGTVWVAWQSWVEGKAEVRLGKADAGEKGRAVSEGPGNAWSPALAVDRRGLISVAFDTYRAGNYDGRRCGVRRPRPGRRGGREDSRF